MITTRDLLRHLAELGIDRSERVLVDWRQKGLLPPLTKVGRGRGKGTAQYWESDVLDQAVACHMLLGRYSCAEIALSALWLSGFNVDHVMARKAWIRRIQKRQARISRIALKEADGFWSIGERWAKQLPEYIRRSKPVEDFIKELPSWLHSTGGDSESFRMALIELFSDLARPSEDRVIPNSEAYEQMEEAVDIVGLENFLHSEVAAVRISSMTESEAELISTTLRCVREVISHWFRIAGRIDYLQSTEIPVWLMQGLIGPALVHGLLSIREVAPELPIKATITTLHRLVISVKSDDIQQHELDFSLSERIRDEWRETRDQIELLWTMPRS